MTASPRNTTLPDKELSAVSMDKVAAMAGVATSTVSRALRGDSRISETTRARVCEISQQLGYRPNPMVAALMAQLRHGHPPATRCNLAWLDFSSDPEEWKTDPVQKAFYEGASSRAHRLGYAISRVPVDDRPPARLARMLRNRGIHGVLQPPFDQSLGIAANIPLPLEEFAIVGVGTRFERPSLHYSSDNQYGCGRLAVLNLWNLGYRRIGYLGEPRVEKIVNGRFFAGYHATLYSELNATPFTPLLTNNDNEVISWLRSARVEAIVSANRRILSILRKGGVSVPGEVAVAHLNVDDVDGARPGEVAGIRQDNFGVGANAVELLASLLYHNEIGVPVHPRGLEVHGKWVDGDTAPSRAPSSKPGRPAARRKAAK